MEVDSASPNKAGSQPKWFETPTEKLKAKTRLHVNGLILF